MGSNTEPVAVGWRIYRLYERAITHWWMPAGLLIFLSGFFWAPSQHNHKIITNYATLLPALLSIFTFRQWRLWFFSTPLIALLLTYLCYMIIMSLTRGQETLAFAHWSFYILLFIFGISARMTISDLTLTRLLAAAAISAAAGGSYALLADLHSGLIWESEYRLIGYGALYNALKSGHLFGAFAVIAVWAGFVDARQRWLHWAAGAVCIFSTLMTGSRAPCIALFTVAVLAIVGNMRGRQRLLVLLLTTFAAAAITALFWQKLSERGMSLRPQIWIKAIVLSLQHPWLGAGLGSELNITVSIREAYWKPLLFRTEVLDTHNVFLAVFFYGGLIGLLFFIAAFGASFLGAWQQRNKSPLFLLAALLQLYGLTTLQFDGGSLIGRPTEYWVLYWLPMALFLHAVFKQRQSPTPQQNR